MSWTQTHWKSVDATLSGLPYPTQLTSNIVDTIDTTGIKFVWNLSGTYVCVNGLVPIDSINVSGIKFWTTLNVKNYYGCPVSSQITHHITTPAACRGLTNLTSVTIPPSVKYIDYLSFWDTGLTSVTIADDCVYQDSSFPAGCVINRYS